MEQLNKPNMEERYRTWVESLARYTVMAFQVGKELAGETYLKRLEEEFYKAGARSAKHWRELSGVKEADPDCIGLGKIMDTIDDSFANWWDGYVQNSPKGFEKHILTCPVAKAWSRAPELCTRMIAASWRGLINTLNPKATTTWNEFLPAGDKTCHYRIEIKE